MRATLTAAAVWALGALPLALGAVSSQLNEEFAAGSARGVLPDYSYAGYRESSVPLPQAVDERAWTSVVNDEAVWEFSVVRVGSTLRQEALHGGRVTSLYFPEEHCRFARLLLTRFPNDALAEVRILGPDRD